MGCTQSWNGPVPWPAHPLLPYYIQFHPFESSYCIIATGNTAQSNTGGSANKWENARAHFSSVSVALILSAVPRPAASASPENLLPERQIIRPHPRTADSESLVQSPALSLNKPSEWFWCSNWRTTEMWHLNSAVLYGNVLNWISLLVRYTRPDMVKTQRTRRTIF